MRVSNFRVNVRECKLYLTLPCVDFETRGASDEHMLVVYLVTASSDRLGRDILTFWSKSEFERSQKKFPRTFPNRVYKSYLPPARAERGQNPWENP